MTNKETKLKNRIEKLKDIQIDIDKRIVKTLKKVKFNVHSLEAVEYVMNNLSRVSREIDMLIEDVIEEVRGDK